VGYPLKYDSKMTPGIILTSRGFIKLRYTNYINHCLSTKSPPRIFRRVFVYLRMRGDKKNKEVSGIGMTIMES
jgi:hypothetical protein